MDDFGHVFDPESFVTLVLADRLLLTLWIRFFHLLSKEQYSSYKRSVVPCIKDSDSFFFRVACSDYFIPLFLPGNLVSSPINNAIILFQQKEYTHPIESCLSPLDIFVFYWSHQKTRPKNNKSTRQKQCSWKRSLFQWLVTAENLCNYSSSVRK